MRGEYGPAHGKIRVGLLPETAFSIRLILHQGEARMALNSYRDEVRDFMGGIGALNEGPEPKIAWLEEEFRLLKGAVCANQPDRIRHQVYDMLFLLFELSADYGFDLDGEWALVRQRKEKNYLTAPVK